MINRRAVLSGALGATASLAGKLGLSPDSPVPSAVGSICDARIGGGGGPAPWWTCPVAALAARGVCLLSMVGANLLVVSSFLEGMEESGSVVGTALSTAANFSFSAAYGMLFFGEIVPPLWYLGAALIAIGMWLLSSVTRVQSSR